ncbi:MAG: hypothetical protein KA785_08935 [Spirochaetaceae bacterium]|nr:hypothetical protein [Spirochaetaceae bacterium]
MIIITKYISIIALFILLVQYVSIFWRGKALDNKLGSKILHLRGSSHRLFYAAAGLIPLIIIVQFFRELDLFVSLVIDGAAIAGLEAVIREDLLKKRSGVYENALIADGRLLWKTDIASFPTLAYEHNEKESQSNADIYAQDAQDAQDKTLKIVTHKSGIIFIGFSSKKERDAAVEIVRTWTE